MKRILFKTLLAAPTTKSAGTLHPTRFVALLFNLETFGLQRTQLVWRE